MTQPSGLLPRVLNQRRDGRPPGSVYVGRPSIFGNPFKIGRDGTREQVIAKYRSYLLSNDGLLRAAKAQLRGKDLVCWCAPQPCHADVLLEVCNDHNP